MSFQHSSPLFDPRIALSLVEMTEAAAISASKFAGMGNKDLIDQAAVDAMRSTLTTIEIDGTVVIGEGEKDEAPMLFIGELVGNGSGPKVDIAVDPIDGTTLLSKGMPGALAAVALSPRNTMNCPAHISYMNKIAVGHEASNSIDIHAPILENLQNIAKAKQKSIEDLVVVVLDRPRHKGLLSQIEKAGSKIKLIPDGDVAAGIQAALPGSDIDVLMGIGGTPEAVLTAAAIRCLGGAIVCKAWPRTDIEKDLALAAGVDLGIVYTTEYLVGGDDVLFAATGASSGELLNGVIFSDNSVHTQSMVMQSANRTIRTINSTHHVGSTSI